jgi:hypothetical protein
MGTSRRFIEGPDEALMAAQLIGLAIALIGAAVAFSMSAESHVGWFIGFVGVLIGGMATLALTLRAWWRSIQRFRSGE